MTAPLGVLMDSVSTGNRRPRSGPLPDLDAVVVGAGVVGLAAARALALRGHEPIVVERHRRFGAETSSRSSEVIHAGLYYPQGSLKARACVEGRAALYRYCEARGVPHRRLGKLVTAADPAQLARLDAIVERAAANGVSDLCRLDAAEVARLEPALRSAGALLSPSTGIVDSHALMQAFDADIAGAGGQVVYDTELLGFERSQAGGFVLRLRDAGGVSEVSAARLVLAAGLFSDPLAACLEAMAERPYRAPRTRFARGRYMALDARAPFSRLVYPVPEPGGLGIHLTLDMAGRARFGPDVEWIDAVDYEAAGEPPVARFEAAIRAYWPDLPEGRLRPDYTGIRPKIVGPGEPDADFAVHGPAEHGSPRLVALFGIESPGLTASLALGDLVAERLAEGG